MGIQVAVPGVDAPFGEVRYIGLVTDAQVAESVATLVTAARETDNWSVLTDCREMVWTPSLADIRAAVEAICHEVDVARYREAMVRPADVTARVSTDHYQTVATNRGLNVQTFDTRDAALAWLTS